MEGTNSIDSAFIVLGKHMSFFNFEILSHIINHLGSVNDQENLARYCTQFETFCERKVFEVPPSVFDSSGQVRKNRKVFVILGTEDLVRTLNDIKVAQRRIASLLGLRVSTLQLRRVDIASIILVFSIPALVGHLLHLDPSIYRTSNSIGFTLIIPNLPIQENLKVDKKDTVSQTSLDEFEADQMSLLSLGEID